MTEELKGIILKISFGEKSDEYADTYLAKLRDRSTYWCTPRRYAGLDGKGRKLIFYDGTRKAITAEVEIQSVSEECDDPDYPWLNTFVPGTLIIYREPISVKALNRIRGFETLGIAGRDRTPYRNMTPSQYAAITQLRRGLASGGRAGASHKPVKAPRKK